jgi:hypothetical protein
MTLIDARTTKLHMKIIGVRDFFEYNSTIAGKKSGASTSLS